MKMKQGIRWAIALAIMAVIGVGLAITASSYISTLISPSQFAYTGNSYKENEYHLSTDMEHKIDGARLYDFSGLSPLNELRIPDSLIATAGKYGRCYQWGFPRNLPMNGTGLGIMAESFTIEAWLQPQSADRIMSWTGITDLASRRLLVATNGSLWAQMTDPPFDFYSSVALGVGSWTHVAFVYNSDVGGISWVINGTTNRAIELGTSYTSSWMGEYRIGGWTDTASYRWTGKMDEFRIAHQALNASRVAEDMNRPIRKTVRIRGLTASADQASLALETGSIPQVITADVNGDADFDTFGYGDSFEARLTIFRDGSAIRSQPILIHTGDEYRFSFAFYASPNVVFISLVIIFPLATAVAYVIRRATSRKPTNKQ